MTITWRTATVGATVDVDTPYADGSIGTPTGHAADDLLLLFAGGKPYSTEAGGPSGFTSCGSVASGSTANGDGVGSVRAQGWYKVDSGAEGATKAITFTAGYDPNLRTMIAADSDQTGSDWVVSSTTGADSSASGTSVSATGGSITVAAGDTLVIFSVGQDDTATESSAAVSLTGATFGTVTQRLSPNTTQIGSDASGYLYTVPVTGGATGAPTFTATSGGTDKSERAVVFVVIREPGAGSTASGSLTLDGSATAAAPVTADGALALEATATAAAPVTAAGSLALAGTATAHAPVTASGSLTLAGTSTAATAATAAGSLTLGGTATADAIPLRAAPIVVSQPASARWSVQVPFVWIGSGVVEESTEAAVTASGSLTLGGTASAGAQVTASGSLSLDGSGTAAAPTTAAGSLTLGGTASAAAPLIAAGSLDLAGSAGVIGAATAAGGLSLAGSALVSGATAAGSLDLAGTCAVEAAVTASGSLTLGGDGSAAGTTVAIGTLTLDGWAALSAQAAAAGLLTLGAVMRTGPQRGRAHAHVPARPTAGRYQPD